ncbi:MAG TPA: glycosyltransferase [Syntrophorhabdaceae bacterium]|nr:glycosyltransferase [Syntrophorhabdaceae bacterium]
MTEAHHPDILHLEACNFVDKPMGGQLSFSRQLMKALGSRLALVGLSNSANDPIGSWFDKEINGIVYRFFAIGSDIHAGSKPFIPSRFTNWFQFRRYRDRIFSIGIPNVIVSEHSILMALDARRGGNLCFYSPGVDSPLSISRYPWAVRFAPLFDRLFFRSLNQKANCILAAADELAIADLRRRAGERLRGKNIITFPTRVDTDIFRPADRLVARERLGLPRDHFVVLTTGRIHWAKGWSFLIESFKLFLDRFPGSLLIFLGDGVERKLLEQKASDLGMHRNVVVAGYQPPFSVAVHLQAADLFVMGSLKEGWSTALVEALACHIPIVTTRFSSADTIVRQGVNGFVVDRDVLEFSQAMKKALSLGEITTYVNDIIDRYALKNLERDLFRAWPILPIK